MSIFTSCAFKKEEDKKKTLEENTRQVIEVLKAIDENSELREQDVVLGVEPNPQVGLYDLVVSWPAQIQKMKIMIDGFKPVIVSKSSEYKITVKHSQELFIHMTALDVIGNELSTFETSQVIPTDKIFDSEESLVQDTVVHASRILFAPDAKIRTNGHKLVLIAEELLLDGNTRKMQNYSEARGVIPHILTHNAKTRSINDPLQPVGEIEIRAKRARGVLAIHSIGLHGSVGEDGNNLSDLIDPRLNAQPPVFKVKLQDIYNPGKDISVSRRATGTICLVERNDPPAPGKKGHKGGNAGNGGLGGDAPAVILNIDDHKDLQVIVVSRPGKGGKPGVPGKGSPGGKGIHGYSFDNSCNPIPNGMSPNGEPGDDGEPGKNGADGVNKVSTSIIPLVYMIHIPLTPNEEL